MKKFRFIFSLFLISLSTFCVHADSLTGNGSLQTWSSSTLGTVASPATGGPYWNNTSGDGPAYDIGWCMTGAGNCSIANPPGVVSYYGNGTSAASTIGFGGASTAQVATLTGLFTNQIGVPPPTGTDVFGWYSVNNGTITTNQLFTSTQAIGTTATFTPSANYGFYLENVQTAGLPAGQSADYFFFMNDSLNYSSGAAAGAIDAGTQHFSVFSTANSYYLGIEDTRLNANPVSDLDYNDMIVELQPAPEPASIALMAGGMSLLGWLVRRRA